MRVRVGSVELEVEVGGSGAPFLLLHGFPLSSEIWAPIRPAVEHAARLVTPDLRGFGRSDKPAGGYGIDQLAEEVVRLADTMGLGEFVLGGHSMGGYVALAVAARHRHRLSGLVLIDSRAEADGPEGRARRDAAIELIERGGRQEFLTSFIPNLVGPSSGRRATRLTGDLFAIADEVPDHVLTACLAAMRDRPDRTAALAEIDLPTLVVVGEEDAVTTADVARSIVARLPRGQLAVVPEAGHTPSVERPIATAEVISAFLRDMQQ